MSTNPAFTDYIAGTTEAMAIVASNYQCGHCNSITTQLPPDANGFNHLAVAHDDGCPVLTGAVSSLPDTLRAAIPATFRPA